MLNPTPAHIRPDRPTVRSTFTLSVLLAVGLCGRVASAQPSAQTPEAAAALPPVRLVAEDWCPHTCDERKGEAGYMVDVVRQILARNDRTTTYHTTSWSRAMRDTQAGAQDLIIGVSSEDAVQLSVTTEAFAFGEYCFYTLASHKWNYTGLASLDQIRLVTPSGLSFDAPLNDWFAKNPAGEKALRFQSEQPLQIMPNRLMQFRSDAMLVSEAVMRYYGSERPRLTALRKAGCYPFREPFYIGAQKDSAVAKTLLPLLDDGLRTLKMQNELAKVYARYKLEPPAR